jgi:hypothetical protein
MSVFKSYKTDSKLERDGVWLDFGLNAHDEPVRFLVARAGPSNKTYTMAMERASKPFKRQIANDTFTVAQADQLMLPVFVDTIVLAAVGLEDENDQPMEGTKENILKIFQRLPDLYYDVREQASKAATFREAELEDSLGNSGRSSATGGSKGPLNEKS